MHSPTFDLALHPTADTIQLLASLLDRMTSANDQLNKGVRSKAAIRKSSSASPVVPTQQQQQQQQQQSYTLFHARSIPSIDIYSYLSRILKYCPCTNECFLSLLVYFDRMSKNALAVTGQPFAIDSYNIHRLIIAGVMVASKFFSDIFYTNTRYAKVGGLPVQELNRLEIEFLQLNDFNIAVSIRELQRYGDQLLKVAIMEKEMRLLPNYHHHQHAVQHQHQQQQQQHHQSQHQHHQQHHHHPQMRHGRSTSLGAPARAEWTADETENHANSVDALTDAVNKCYIVDDATRRASNGVVYAYASPTLSMRRMGSMGSLNGTNNQPSPATTASSTVLTTPPLFVRPNSAQTNARPIYHTHQRHSFVDPSTSSPPQPHTRQRHGSMGWYDVYRCQQAYYPQGFPQTMPPPPIGTPAQPQNVANGTSGLANGLHGPNPIIHAHASPLAAPSSSGMMSDAASAWRAPRQSRSSINLCQQATATAMAAAFVPVDPHFINSNRRLSVSSVHSSSATFIPPQAPSHHHHHRPAHDPFPKHPNLQQAPASYYPPYSIGIPTPPPSLSPMHQQDAAASSYTSTASQQLYL
ncbi:cyclin-domain-containing protein [Gongronella butleri]|nr:cyclin-domain-containing protein [Gongronella butleri]